MIIIVDMQVGMLSGAPKHDVPGLIGRINALTAMVRDDGGRASGSGIPAARRTALKGTDQAGSLFPIWSVGRTTSSSKMLNDPFVGTSLANILTDLLPHRVLVTGWATDFCVDATVRSAVSHGHHVVAVSDGHRLSGRPHLSASAVITHHNWVWSNLITNRTIRVLTTNQSLRERNRI